MSIKPTKMEKQLLAFVERSATRCTPEMIRKFMQIRCSLNRSESRSVLRSLTDAGLLAYRYEFGCTFVALPLNRPVRLGESVVALPVGQTPGKAHAADHCITLNHGQSFGGGDHPTTRLAIAGMEKLRGRAPSLFDGDGGRQLDIGTGSGILLIAGLLFGIGSGAGTDIDSCARFEAKENCRLNGLEARSRILEKAPPEPPGGYTLVTANLRYPTLVSMQPWIAGLVHRGGAVVLSGIRAEELAGLRRCYCEGGLSPVWKAVQSGWAGLALEKRPAGDT